MRGRLGLYAVSLAALSVPLAASPARAQRTRAGVIDGIVTDTLLVPLDRADITVLSTSLRIETGPSGHFRIIEMPAGQYLVIVRHIGFRPVSGIIEVAAGDTVRLSYALERSRSLSMLDTTRITERRPTERRLPNLPMLIAEFEGRRSQGIGQFITEKEIAKQGSVFATEILRTFRGMRIIPNDHGGWMALSAHVVGSLIDGGSGPCYTEVFVDGVRTPVPANLDLLPSPKEIVGVEFYDAMGTVPPEYSRYGVGCGVLLIWTRRG